MPPKFIDIERLWLLLEGDDIGFEGRPEEPDGTLEDSITKSSSGVA